ncbi:sodium/bile acid cotransporter 7-B-like [Oscarella lobularis]|uniref:sodium/bile acid cotransporter 7-B-like n=1 Tax=Oscarella lobularis TaxID=121494 RepID=UPI00331362DB
MLPAILQKARKEWFLIGLICAIYVAKLYPYIGRKGGPLMPEVTVKYIGVSVIFFNSGLSLKTEDLKEALFSYKIHAFIQLFTLVLIPCTLTTLVHVLRYTDINRWLLDGLLIVSCMPPPVSSAVILTKAVGGNEAAALFNSAFGSILGIFVTPGLLLLLVGTSANVPFQSVLGTLGSTVMAPVVVGQILRMYIKEFLDKVNIPFGAIGRMILLLIIFTTFCDTFSSDSGSVEARDFAAIIIIVVCSQLVFLCLAFLFSTRALPWYTRSDVVAIIFCSTHKSLTLGIPMLKIIYSGYEHLSLISIPLLVYHPVQILLGSLLVPVVQSWMRQGRAMTPAKQDMTAA